jgi:hypothetical protein
MCREGLQAHTDGAETRTARIKDLVACKVFIGCATFADHKNFDGSAKNVYGPVRIGKRRGKRGKLDHWLRWNLGTIIFTRGPKSHEKKSSWNFGRRLNFLELLL